MRQQREPKRKQASKQARKQASTKRAFSQSYALEGLVTLRIVSFLPYENLTTLLSQCLDLLMLNLG